MEILSNLFSWLLGSTSKVLTLEVPKATKKERKAWSDMKQRCYNPNNSRYKNYGGRGIKVCSAWLQSFDSFYETLGPAPEGYGLDRIDVHGDYEPSNCRWQPKQDFSKNSTKAILITRHGKTMCLAEWARFYGKPVSTVKNRYRRTKNFDQAIA